MIIVSDTSPITNLIQIGKLDLLKNLYKKIFIPHAVLNELFVLENQVAVLKKEKWIEPIFVESQDKVNELLTELDKGEAEAIVLAIDKNAELLLIDEQRGRKIAEKNGIKVTGVLGILVKAKQEGLISEVRFYMEQLREEAGFRIHPKLFETILKIVGEL